MSQEKFTAKQIATFFTHTGAMEFYAVLKDLGDSAAEIGPVPRRFSVSCGTGVIFEIPFDADKMTNPDLEYVYCRKGAPEEERYERVWEADNE